MDEKEHPLQRFEGLIDVGVSTSLRVGVIGCGRVGTAIILQLIKWFVQKIVCIDHDVVSEKEKGSVFPLSLKEKYKVRAVKRIGEFWNPAIQIIPILLKISTDSIPRFLEAVSDIDLMFLCIDAWDMLEEIVEKTYSEIPTVAVAIGEEGSWGEIAWSVSGQSCCVADSLDSTNRISEGGASSLPVDVDAVANVAVRVGMGIALAARKGFELFQPLLSPDHSLLIVNNRPNNFSRSNNLLVPQLVRLISTEDLSCNVCRGREQNS